MINKILISRDKRIILHRDKRTLGMNGENLQEVLLFVLDEKIEGTGIVEVELPSGEKGMIEVERTEEGYELPIKSSLMSQTGFVKFQLRILHDEVEIFKSEIIALAVKDSINATETIPEQYPSWIDNLENLKQDLEKAEQERVSNENERMSAEETRQDNFTEMQKTVENAVSNIKDLTEEYNSNAEKETKKFNDNADEKTKTFNDNSDNKLAEYNKNHTDKMKEFNDNYDAKTKAFDDNAAAKLEAYNKNDTEKTNAYNANDKAKTDAYNNNTALKEKAYNDNATTKTETFNSNVEQKENELEDLAEEKINEYNQVSAELNAKIEQVQAENEALKSENKLIKEQIPSASVSGNSVHVEDSSNLDFEWKIKGGHAQVITTQSENYVDDREARGKTILEATSLYLPIINLKAGSGYYFKIFDNNDKIKNDSRYLAVEFYDIDKTKIQSDALGYPNTFTEENVNKIKFAKIYYNKNDTDKAIGSIVIKKIGLKITSSASADDIDMFVPNSPSLDYPSEIETVGSNVNLFDGELESGSLANNSGQNYANAKNTRSKNYIAVEENTTYVLSDNIKGSFIVHAYDENKNWISMIGAQNYTGQYIFVTPATTAYIRFRTNETDLAAKIKLEKNSNVTPWSPPGIGSVKVTVENSNLLDFNVTQDSRVTVNEDGTLTINGAGGFSLNIDKLQLKAGITYYQKVELISGSISGSNINNTFLSFAGAGKWIPSEIFTESSFNEDTEKTAIWINASAIFDNAVIKIWANTDKSDFVKHQSQTAIMPIQQEMLTEDYVADIEHHEWGKCVLTGDESNISKGDSSNGITQFNIAKVVYKNPNTEEITANSNYFLGVKWDKSWTIDNCICNTTDGYSIRIMTSAYTTVEDFKAMLKSKYEAGTPVIIYYKLAEPLDLELTSEQKAARDTKLYTYKNITNISLSDELASIDVEYKKDQDTINKNYENRLAALETASTSEEAE